VLPAATINILASRTVRADPVVVGGETHGAVELRANVSPDSDFLAIGIEVLRDGTLLQTLRGEVANFVIPEGEFGDYTYRFVAERAATPENAETLVPLGEIGRTYRLRRWAMAISTLLGGLLLLYVVVRGFVVLQYPRTWRLRVTTDSPWRNSSLADLDSRLFKFDQPGKKGQARPQWGVFQWNKELRIRTSDILQQFELEEREGPLAWLADDGNVLRVRPTGERLLDSPGEGWDGPQTHESRRDVQIFARQAAKSRPDDKSLYAWLEAKAPPPTGWIVAILLTIGALAAWLWYAMNYCNLFR
jgi:hypothetical protein